MPITPLSTTSPNALDEYQDLRSVPSHRHFGRSNIIDRFRLAVPFDHIYISGLDVDHYRFGRGVSVDTDMPPAYVDAYTADRLAAVDPFALAARDCKGVLMESEVYAVTPPPQRVEYLARSFGIRNRTLFPVMRNDLVYGAVCYTRETPFDAEELQFLSLVSSGIHTEITRPLMERFAAQQMRLTKGEIACLAKASLGLTSEEIATQTGYQSDTVNSYIKNAVKKLGAANRSQAIAEAIRRRLID
ncbi:LuxR C-terminal-related transcriptional regulator [Rhizobium sp. LjRoot30]|uniref:autoinducer binding domain-containing protein n=1 Tax=Rhizobium sp. LjRoot30 TaxID=3342320 RepID=UPI003ECEF428